MPKNRYLPYGYYMKNGVVTVNLEEAEIVRKVYRNYATGASYKKIAEQLTQQEVRYTPEKLGWNKNMVARILQNANYLGNERYPAIVDEQLAAVAEAAQKAYTHKIPAELKVLKPHFRCAVCGASMERRHRASGLERWYCAENKAHLPLSLSDVTLLKSMLKLQRQLAKTSHTKQTSSENIMSLELIRLQNELDQLLDSTALNEQKIQQTVLTIAQTQYDLSADCADTITQQQLQTSPTKLDVKRLVKLIKTIPIGEKGATIDNTPKIVREEEKVYARA